MLTALTEQAAVPLFQNYSRVSESHSLGKAYLFLFLLAQNINNKLRGLVTSPVTWKAIASVGMQHITARGAAMDFSEAMSPWGHAAARTAQHKAANKAERLLQGAMYCS